MKIAIMDPNLGRFTADMKAHWEAQGHEVKMERYYNPELVKWGEVVYFDTCDNNLKSGCYPPKDNPDFAGYDMHEMDLTGKKIICRVIDIEVWLGHHLNVDWYLVTDVIFIAPHIKEMVEKDVKLPRTHLIPCGVNLERFTFRDRQKGTRIAWVCERWPSKGIDYMLQILALLPPEYTIHSLGYWNDIHPWEMAYFNDFIDRNNLRSRFEITEYVDDVNEWMEDKDFILSCSKKEAFAYNVAEGMAKGMKPIIHNFYGCDKIWDKYTWERIDEAVAMITSDEYYSHEYRDYLIKKGYTSEAMMQQIDKVISG